MDADNRGRRERPSILVVLLMLAGVWAAMATSPAVSSGEATGSTVVDADQPAARIIATVDGGADTERLEIAARWTATSENGVDPQISVVTTGSAQSFGNGAALTQVAIDGSTSELELAVANIEQTGPVIIEWRISASMEGEDVQIDVSADATAVRPSGVVSLPVVRRGFDRLGLDDTLFEVDAEFDAAGTVTVERRDDSSEAELHAVVDGTLIAIDPATTIEVPTDGATCGPDRCTMSFILAAHASPAIGVDAGDGSVAAIVRDPAVLTTWVPLTPQPLLAERHDVSIDVAMPDDPGNPFAGHALLVARVPDDRDPIIGRNCFAPIEYSTGDQPFVEMLSFVSDETGGRSLALEDDAVTRVDLRVGTTDPGQYCDADADNVTLLEIGVMTLGVDDASPAKVSLR